ncbi:MAG: adenylate/guanylate cyclase domain-containing protein [Hyphomicrobiales bacterium]|nr:MAG: adenylate/guanylate cyclase domain-containing protein [Hyphomicrobiales bacterium]
MKSEAIGRGLRAILAKLRAGYAPIMLVILLAVVGLRVADPPLLKQLRLMVFDNYQRLSPRSPSPDKPVLIIDIDDASLERIGQWPWPRNTLARLLEKIRISGAAAVGIDFVFPEPDRLSPEQAVRIWPESDGLAEVRKAVKGMESHDSIFGREIGQGRVVMGFMMRNTNPGQNLPQPKASFAFAGDNPKSFVPFFPGAVFSLPEINKGVKGLGFLNWIPDRDQVVRRVPLLARAGGQLYPSLSVEALRIAQDASTLIVKSSGASGEQSYGKPTGVISLRVGAGILPTNARGELLVHFGYWDRSKYIPAWKVLQDKVEPDLFAGRIVLIGTSAPGLFDMRATPLEAAVPGIDIHAQAIEQVIEGRFLYRPDYALGVEILYVSVVALLMILLLPRIGAAWSAVAGGVLISIMLGISYGLFVKWGWLSDPVYPSLAALMVYLIGSAIVFLHSDIERKRVRSAFSHYLAPNLVEQLSANPDRLVLGGELREITMMFSDVRGFTGIAEGLNSHELITLINKVLSPISESILNHQGTIDKYMGDAVMAFWNAPLDDPDHPRNAALAAIDMQKRLVGLNADLSHQAREDGREFIKIRLGVGLCSGPSSVGNMGTENRFDYSVIGDTVNIASRLEGLTRIYGVDILMAQSTAAKCAGLALLEVDKVRVKGREQPVNLYALVGGEDYAGSDEFRRLAQAHGQMIESYRERLWDEALRDIERCLEHADERTAEFYRIYCARIEEYRENPPGEDWDGVFTALTK